MDKYQYEPCVVRLCIHVNADGLGFVPLTAHEGRKDIFAFLDERGFNALKELVELRHTGKLLTMDG